MDFEHLVQINDFSNPLLPVLTRKELWQGLLLKVHQPQLFIPAIESASITQINEHLYYRELSFGKFTVIDHVSLIEMESTHYQVQQPSNSSLIITIEEPAKDHFFLRFRYQTMSDKLSASDLEQAQTEYFQKEAYRASDIDAVALIRQLSETNH